MNPNVNIAIDKEESGVEEEVEDIDYDTLYGGEDINDISPEKTEDIKDDYKRIFKDVLKQGTKETLIGLGGTYGDLAELIGLNAESPAQEARSGREFDILEKMKKEDYQPSYSDIASLTEDSDIPSFSKLPTSESLRDINEKIGGPGEAETNQGKYAGRIGKLTGAGLAFGQVNPIPAILSGTAGQAVEEGGYGPLAQTAAEIVTLLATQGKSKPTQVSSLKKEVQSKISDLRKLGYTEEDITLAINAANKGGNASKIASKGSSTEKAFEDFAEHSDQIVKDILSSEIPGIESGTQKIHQLSSDTYGEVAKEASKLTITNSKPFLDASKKVVDQLQNTLGKNPEAQAFIKRISEAAIDSTQFPSAESFMNFYKELNAMGNWLGRSQKDRLINQVKNGIKDTFKGQGKAGKELAEKFEKANQGIRKAYRAEEVHDLIQKATTQKGIDYKKINKLYDNPENVQLFEEVLGKSATKNIKMISNVNKEIKDFDKAWKIVNNFSVGTGLDIGRGIASSYYIYQGDWEGLAAVLGTKIGTAGIKKLAEKSLTDPKMQNLLIRGLHAIKISSPKTFKSADEAMKKYLEEEGIDLD